MGFRSRSARGHAFEVLIYLKRESPKEIKIGIRFTILTASFLFPEATNETLMLSILGGGTRAGRIDRDLQRGVPQDDGDKNRKSIGRRSLDNWRMPWLAELPPSELSYASRIWMGALRG